MSSSSSAPISAATFAVAIKDLPLPNLYAKAAELQNSIAHLHHSNTQLEPFAEEGDPDCSDAIKENAEVVGRMQERISLLRLEVEGRGARWMDAEVEEKEAQTGQDVVVDGINGDAASTQAPAAQQQEAAAATGGGGRLTDEELRSRLRDMVESGNEDDDGVHL